MTIQELAELPTKEWRKWVNNATRGELAEMLNQTVEDELQDMDTRELREYAYEMATDGTSGFNTWGRRRLQTEIRAVVKEAASDIEYERVQAQLRAEGDSK